LQAGAAWALSQFFRIELLFLTASGGIMRSTVTIIFNSHQSIERNIEASTEDGSADSARDWFDDTWTRLGCEPLRPSGKVLLLDKVLGVADALGYGELAQNDALMEEFATQAALALGKPRIIVDLPGSVVGF
jgi:hypothetical protein